jgi:hypothetical protein
VRWDKPTQWSENVNEEVFIRKRPGDGRDSTNIEMAIKGWKQAKLPTRDLEGARSASNSSLKERPPDQWSPAEDCATAARAYATAKGDLHSQWVKEGAEKRVTFRWKSDITAVLSSVSQTDSVFDFYDYRKARLAEKVDLILSKKEILWTRGQIAARRKQKVREFIGERRTGKLVLYLSFMFVMCSLCAIEGSVLICLRYPRSECERGDVAPI